MQGFGPKKNVPEKKKNRSNHVPLGAVHFYMSYTWGKHISGHAAQSMNFSIQAGQAIPEVPIGTCNPRHRHMHKSLSPRPGRCQVQPCTFYLYLPTFIACVTGLGGIPRFLGIYPDFSVYPKALYRDFWVYQSLYPNVPQIALAYLCGRAHMYYEPCCKL